MSQRYIQRGRLQPRQYTAGCPVVLSAGALLDDTELSQQAAQLKFISISARPVTALTAEIRGFDESGVEIGSTVFRYEVPSLLRGQAFGQHTAVPLPWNNACRLRVMVSGAVFEDGAEWALPDGAVWGVLPEFRRLDWVLRDPDRLNCSREALGGGTFAFRAPADLWYCTCGGVNRQEEPLCHRCLREKRLVEAYAVPHPMGEAWQEERAEQPEQRAKAAQPVLSVSAAEESSPVKESVAEGVTLDVAPIAVPEVPPCIEEAASGVAEAGKRRPAGRKKGLIAVAAIVLAAVVVLLVGRGGNLLSGSPAKTEIVIPVVTTPADRGTTATVILTETEENRCRMTYEMLHEAVPEALDFSSYDCSPLGEEIDTYLSFSHHMMSMVYQEEEELRGSGYNNIYVGETSSIYTVLLFSDPTTLCGYFIGKPESLGDGKWQMTFTLCDYDFEALYRQRAAAFAAAETDKYPYIAPDDVAGCGAAYFYFGYGSNGFYSGSTTEQMYYMWTQMTSPYAANYRKPIENLEKRLPTAEKPFWRYFLLLDENEEVLGFTLYSPQWVTGPDHSGSTRWDGTAAAGFGGGNGLEQDPYIIRTAQQLAYLAESTMQEGENQRFSDMHFRLEADLDLNGIEWSPIGGHNSSFRGHFDGNNHTIRGLEITKGSRRTYENGQGHYTAGLFGSTYGAVIRDLTVEGVISVTQPDPNYDGSFFVGGIVGNAGAEGTFINCHNRCTIILEDYGEESSHASVGGITGSIGSEGLLDGCSNSGEIYACTARYANAGGITGGGGASTIINCWNTGSITMESMTDDANGEVAGIVPHPYNSLVLNCCNLGALRCDGQMGGIAAYVYDSEEYPRDSLISNCYTTGDIVYTGDNHYWNPAGAFVYGLSEDCSLIHCFYAEDGPAITGSHSEGTVEEIFTYDAAGNTVAGEPLADALNRWVDANNADGSFARWKADPISGELLPVG